MITICSANMNRYHTYEEFDTILKQRCIKSWDNLKSYLNSKGIECCVKLYTCKDIEVKQFRKETSNIMFKTQKCEANAFKFYLLKLYPNYIWLDWDIFVTKDVNIDLNDIFINNDLSVLYNKDKLSLFNNIYNRIIASNYCHNNDYIFNELGIKENVYKDSYKHFINFGPFDYDKIKPIKEVSNKDDLNSSEYLLWTKDYIPNIFSCYEDKEVIQFVQILINYYKRPYLPHLEIDLCNVCNLQCAACNHLTPLAKEHWFIDLDYLTKLLTDLNNKFEIGQICFAGGEPFTHPKIIDIFKLTRDIYPNSNIKVFTNGLLLKKFISDANIINDLEINLYVSYYKIIPEETEDLYLKNFKYINLFRDRSKIKFNHSWFNLIDNNDYVHNFNYCNLASCVSFKNDGRVYQCPPIMFIHNLNYFKKDIHVPEEDCSIDIFKSTNLQILNFLNTPQIACRYCDIEGKNKQERRETEYNIEEWVKIN